LKLSSNFIYFHNELGLKKTIDAFADAGFDAIDFNADLQEYYTDEHDRDFYREIRAYAADRGITFDQTHAPFASSYAEEDRSARRFGEIVKSMEHSAWLGAQMVVVHPCAHIGCDTESGRAEMFAYNLDFYRKLLPYAEEYGVKIAIENIRGTITEAPEGLLSLLDALDSGMFTVCFDVGHANLSGDPAVILRQIGGRIGCTHIHDNDGKRDIHTLPHQGIIDWEAVMRALAEVGYTGNLNYVAGRFVMNTPIEMRPEAARYMAKVGQYLIGRCQYFASL